MVAKDKLKHHQGILCGMEYFTATWNVLVCLQGDT